MYARPSRTHNTTPTPHDVYPDYRTAHKHNTRNVTAHIARMGIAHHSTRRALARPFQPCAASKAAAGGSTPPTMARSATRARYGEEERRGVKGIGEVCVRHSVRAWSPSS